MRVVSKPVQTLESELVVQACDFSLTMQDFECSSTDKRSWTCQNLFQEQLTASKSLALQLVGHFVRRAADLTLFSGGRLRLGRRINHSEWCHQVNPCVGAGIAR